MAEISKIEWTDASWNPVTGCTKISIGCKHCYAERLSIRLKTMGNANYQSGFILSFHQHMLHIPLRWKKPRMVFVNSMSDLFHEDIPLDFIQKVFKTMADAHWHKFQVLTKRSSRLLELDDYIDWPSNVWMGVSVENDDFKFRINDLKLTNAVSKFISFEPLIGSINSIDLNGIDWVIVGGESGPGARPISKEWIFLIRDACLSNKVPFFFKQWGGTNKKKSGRLLEGRTWDDFPESMDRGST